MPRNTTIWKNDFARGGGDLDGDGLVVTSDVAVRALIRDTDAYEDHPACIAAKRDLATRLQGRPPVLQQRQPGLAAALRLPKAVRRRFLVVGLLLQFRGKGFDYWWLCAAVFENYQGVSGGAQPLIGFGQVLPAKGASTCRLSTGSVLPASCVRLL